ncbi:MAG: PEP-CTERM sorting domain-containing protein [Gemmatirosa sp.]|nr:PEP-CTERM sorting domain-containing protein [Gemmatirosa sp.]
MAHPLALAALLAALSAPASAQYAFTAIARSTGGFDPFGFGTPALNASGQVAFVATTEMERTTSVFRYTGGALTTIASTTGDFNRFGDVSINASGQVGFEGSFASVSAEGIFRGDGTSVTTIAATRSAGPFDFVNAGPSLNASGLVAFNGALEVNFTDGIYVGSGGPVVPLYDDTGAVDNFNGNPSLNDLGYVAFGGSLAGGPTGIFLGNGGPLTTLADNSGGFFTFFFDPSLNEHNDVAFYAAIDGGTAQGIFFSHLGAITPIIQGDFTQFGEVGFEPSLNNVGQVAYTFARNFGEEMIAIGPDPDAGHVIGFGDMLFGHMVTGVNLSREGLNDAGQVAFEAFFDDGSSGIFLATPGAAPPTSAVPEPATLVLVGGGLLVLGVARRRRPVR